MGGTGRSYHLIGHFSRAPKSPHRVIFVQPVTGFQVASVHSIYDSLAMFRNYGFGSANSPVSHSFQGPEYLANDVDCLGEAGIGRVVGISGEQLQPQWPRFAHRLDTLHDKPVSIP